MWCNIYFRRRCIDKEVVQFRPETELKVRNFSIKLTQDGTGGYGVGIDTFVDNGGNPIDVYWPGGGVVPIPTTTASKTDIYSFKTFDGGSSLYGVVGGQNFA